MRHALAIARREIRSYFVSPVAYVAMTVFALLSGFFFSNMLVYYISQAALADQQIQKIGRSDYQLDVPTVVLGEFFKNEAMVVLLVLPLLTMGLITDERRKGTLELLLTSPVRAAELVAGKFLAALSLFGVMLLPTLPYYYFLARGGEWEPGVVLAGYLGLILLASTAIAVGLFVSSLCENVLVSAFGTYGLLVLLFFIDTSTTAVRSLWSDVVGYFSVYVHYLNFARGVLRLGDVVYLGTIVTLGLFLTERTIEAIRFKRS
jgi:ABC-2 type transport system permease protein